MRKGLSYRRRFFMKFCLTFGCLYVAVMIWLHVFRD